MDHARAAERMSVLLPTVIGGQWKNWDAAIAENRRRDEIFAMVIHELRSPLAAITAAACVIERTAELTAAGGQPAIEVLKRQSRVLSRIVDDLSDLSRIGRDKLEVSLEWLEIHPIIADAVLAAQPRITSRRQELRTSLPREEIRCHVDAVRLVQILINLLDNASKYTPDGGHIELAVVCRPRTVDLTVHDDGVGIPPDKLREIFEPFTQLRSPDARPSEGLGVGLALVDKLVKMLDGSLRAASAGPGKGAEFTVSLPRHTSSHGSAR
jgi:signal transduction histidine kinase